MFQTIYSPSSEVRGIAERLIEAATDQAVLELEEEG